MNRAGFVACHQFEFVDKIDVLEHAAPGAAFLLNAPFPADEVWDQLPTEMQEQIVEKKLRFFAIDAYDLAKRSGMGTRINTIMQTCFFSISGILPADEAIKHIKKSIEKSYGKRGPEVVRRNCEVVDQALAQLHEITVPASATSQRARPPLVSATGAGFRSEGDRGHPGRQRATCCRSARSPIDGTWPMATAKWEKRNIALEIPVWDSKICIQCNQCALVCPHAAIRAKVYDESELAGAPPTFKSTLFRSTEHKGKHFTIQVAPEDCTGCNLCVNVCPARIAPTRSTRRSTCTRRRRCARRSGRTTTSSSRVPELDRTDDDEVRSQELAVSRAAVRILGRLRGMRRDAVSQAAHAALRRPAAHGQRDRLLVDLRRQSADDAVLRRTATAGAPRGRTRSSRTTRSSGSASGWRSMRTPPARGVSSSNSRHRSATDWPRRCWTRISRVRPASRRSARARRRPAAEACRREGRRSPPPRRRSPTIS